MGAGPGLHSSGGPHLMVRRHYHTAHARQNSKKRYKMPRILPVIDLIVVPEIKVQVMAVHKLKAKFRSQKSVLRQE